MRAKRADLRGRGGHGKGRAWKPEEELGPLDRDGETPEEQPGETGDEDLDVFRDFIEGLDIDN